MKTHSPLIKEGVFFWGVVLLSIQPACAEIIISKIETGPHFKDVKHQTEISSSGSSPLRIKNSADSFYFHFHQKRKPEEEAFRLRYKLDGYDDKWRDLTEGDSSKVSIQFTDQLQKIVGTEDFVHTGETPGWTGSIEQSPFIEFSHQFVVPERTVAARIVLNGPLPAKAGMGLVALDDCKLKLSNQAGQDTEIDLRVLEGLDLEHPLGSPTLWSRKGTGAGLAVLREVPTPTPHPVIAIIDTNATTAALWVTDREHHIPLSPGDEVTFSYRIAHSLGLAGPGVVHYDDLQPGRYHFRVAAARSNGELTGEEVSIPFDILQPLRHRWEFWTALALIIMVALAWIRKVVSARTMRQKRTLEEREKALDSERSRIARDLHDDLGAGLTEIAMQSDLVKQEITSGTPENALRRIESVCNSAISLTRSVDEIVWAVNPANDTLDHFVNYLSQTTEEFLDAAAIRVRFQIPADLPPAVLPGKMRHNLYLVVREALNNLAKHASCDLVTLKVEYCDEVLTIVVQDNGCGFRMEDSHQSAYNHGLTNMENRMNEIGGSHQMTTHPEQGTVIEFRLPVPLTLTLESHARTS